VAYLFSVSYSPLCVCSLFSGSPFC